MKGYWLKSIKFKALTMMTIIVLGTLGLFYTNYSLFVRAKNINNWNAYSLRSIVALDSLVHDFRNLTAENKNLHDAEIREYIKLTDKRFQVLKLGSKSENIVPLEDIEIKSLLQDTGVFWEAVKRDLLDYMDGGDVKNKVDVLESLESFYHALELETDITSQLTERMTSDFITYQLIYISIFLTLLVFVFYHATDLTNRTLLILDAVKKINLGNYNVNIEARGGDEVSELSKNFNEMVNTLRKSTVSSSYFGSVINSIENMIFDIDADGNVYLMNDKAKEFFRCKEDREFNIFQNISNSPQSIDELQNLIQEKSFLILSNDKNDEIYIKTIVSDLNTNEYQTDKKRYILSIIDISSEKEMEAQLQQAAKMASIGELASGIAHEINNPLTVLYGDVRRIEKTDTEGQYSESTKRIHKNITRIQNIVKGLKVFSRQDALNKGEMSFNADSAIVESVDLLKEMYHAKGIVIEHDLNSSSRVIKGAQSQFQQVIVNLIGNAKDAYKDKEGKILISSKIRGDQSIVEIQDFGCGISQKNLEKIFNTFFTTKEPGKGTGLGMSISKKIINDLGGDISVTSIVGEGTTFKISLPSFEIQKNAQELSSGVAPHSASHSTDKFSHLKDMPALVVDDEEDIRFIIKDMIYELFELNITEAVDGGDALKKIQENSFNFVFTDIQMPNKNGLELIKEIPEAKRKKMKLIVITGGAKSEEQLKEIEKHSDYIIYKPINEEKLCQLMSEVTGSSKKAA